MVIDYRDIRGVFDIFYKCIQSIANVVLKIYNKKYLHLKDITF